MVCAVACVYEPQILERQRHPPGWDYFFAVRILQNELTLIGATTLVDVQVIAVSHPDPRIMVQF